MDGVLRVWELMTGKAGRKLRACRPSEPVDFVAFDDAGLKFVSLAFGCVRVWSRDGELLQEIERIQGSRCCLTPSGNCLIVGRRDALDVWDLTTRALINSIRLPGVTVTSVAALPDERTGLIGCGDGEVLAMTLDDGVIGWRAAGHPSSVTTVTTSPDGAHGLSGGADGEVVEWALADGSRVRRLMGHTAAIGVMAYAKDGGHALTADENRRIKFWDMKTGFLLRTIKMAQESALGLGFSRDGLRAFAGSRPVAVCIWDLSTGDALPLEQTA